MKRRKIINLIDSAIEEHEVEVYHPPRPPLFPPKDEPRLPEVLAFEEHVSHFVSGGEFIEVTVRLAKAAIQALEHQHRGIVR